jgi:hypothetical protein
MRRIRQICTAAAVLLLLGLASAPTRAASLTISVTNFDFSGSGFDAAKQTLAQNLFTSARNSWTSLLGGAANKDVNLVIDTVEFLDLGATNGGNTTGATADANGNPGTVTKIQISSNAVMFYSQTITGIGATEKDALSVMVHELGHAVGFNFLSGTDGYQKWNDRITGTDFKLLDDSLVTMAGATANGLSHIATSYAATDLMNLSVGFGQRRSISTLDLKMLQAAFGYAIIPEPSTILLAGFGLASLAGLGYARRRRAA